LKEKIKSAREEKNDTTLAKCSTDSPASGEKHKLKRTLKGHLQKIYSLHWSRDPNHLVSASQDGKLLVWDALSTNKTHGISLKSGWVMSCGYSPSGSLVAAGGLDNLCSIYSLSTNEVPIKATRELVGHNGFLSGCRFLDDKKILSSSADGTCILWDIEAKTPTTTYEEHSSDILALEISSDMKTFLTGGCDFSAKIWDVSSGKCVQSFYENEDDINGVTFFPNGHAFATGSENGTCRLFDIRAYRELVKYSSTSTGKIATCVSFSISGRYLFSGYDDGKVVVWDSLNGSLLWSLDGHTDRISCMGVNVDGTALCTGGWENYLKVWA